MTYADSLNGITWHGDLHLSAGAYREFAHNWQRWRGDGELQVYAKKENGKWSFEVGPPKLALYTYTASLEKISCDSINAK